MVFEKLLVLVAIGTFAGEAKRSLVEESFEIITFFFNFIASAFLGFSLGYVFYYLRGREELAPFLGGLIGYFGSDFAEGRALVYLQNRLGGGG